MKKLLIVGSNSIHTYRYIYLIRDYFDKILLLSNSTNNQYNVETIEINFKLSFNIFDSCIKIRKIIKEFNPSIIHVHQANSYGFLTTLASINITIPKVVTTWGSDILLNPKKSFFLKKMLQYTLKNSDLVTSDSLFVAGKIKSYTNKSYIKIVNFGIDNIIEKPMIKEKIIYSNRLHKTLYNIDKVIYSFEKFVQKNKEWRLVIGASGSETEQLKKLVIKLNIDDNVEFIGWVNPKINNEFYQKSTIYISIPSSDATAISLLEAISSNAICFVSNLPANCEHILDGINGFIEPNLDDIDFNKYKLIDDNILKSVNKKREFNYLKDTNKKKFISIYDELVGEN